MIFRIYAAGEFVMNFRIWSWEANDFIHELRSAFKDVVVDHTHHTVELL